MRNLQQVQIKNGSSWEKICPFPVGYIYMSTNSTSPASTYGGTWSALTDSRFLRPSGSWNSTGGESTHTLTISEMPSHQHSYPVILIYQEGSGGSAYTIYGPRTSSQGNLSTASSGGGAAHNNLPPYRTCYAWYRTA